MRMTLLACMLMSLMAAASYGAGVDQSTTFLAHFDESAAADFCAGDWRAGLSGEPSLTEGKFGQALDLEAGKRLSYPSQGNIEPDAGTIEMWLQWLWEPGTDPSANILYLTTPDGSYLRMNTVVGGRLGVAYNVGKGDAQNWKRVEIPPPDWQPGQWHHLAVTWGDGVLRLYIDGALADEETGIVPLEGQLSDIALGPGPLVIDELRISSVARSPEEIMTDAIAEPEAVQTRYLTSLEPALSEQAMGAVGIDAETAIDDRTLPLAIGTTAYARGVAIRTPGRVEYQLPEGVVRLTGVAGISAFAGESDTVRLVIKAGDKQLFGPADFSAGDQPQELDLQLQGVKSVTLEAQPAAGHPGVGVFADLALLGEGAQRPRPFAREMTEDEITTQRMRADVGRFTFDLPEAPKGHVIYAGHPVDAITTDVEPLGERFPERMLMKASPGEYEAIQFTVCAAQDLPSVEVTCGGLSGPGQIGADDVQVLLLRRVLQRRGYWMDRKAANFDTVSRFLFPDRSFWLPQGDLKEVQVLVHVPEGATPGQYSGTVTVALEGGQPTQLSLDLEVFPIELVQPRDRRYGCYYSFADMLDTPDRLDAELADQAAHGCTTIIPGVGIEFAKADDDTITWSFDTVRAMLDALRRHGGFGPIPVHNNINRLAGLMGHKGLAADGSGEPLADQQDLLEMCRKCFFELKALNTAEYPEFEICLTHMDEVFGRDRLPRYIDQAQVIRATTDMRIYITHHTQPGAWEAMMAEADPYIDIRSMNGHSLETWLHAGNSFEEMAKLVEDSGDEAWIYHNMRGSFFMPQWNRIINGLWMWTSPIVVHVPWKYYAYGGDPFDDTDSDRFDFGYAFPDPAEPTRLISTLHWEAFREGYDDMRYIVTLEGLIAQAEQAGVNAGPAKAWLAEMRGMLPKVPDDIMNIDEESPLCVAYARSFSGADYDRMRWQTAEQIIALQKALGR